MSDQFSAFFERLEVSVCIYDRPRHALIVDVRLGFPSSGMITNFEKLRYIFAILYLG